MGAVVAYEQHLVVQKTCEVFKSVGWTNDCRGEGVQGGLAFKSTINTRVWLRSWYNQKEQEEERKK